jgi:hypothetical protein
MIFVDKKDVRANKIFSPPLLGSGMDKIQDLGSGINILDPQK